MNIEGGYYIISNILDVRIPLPVDITQGIRIAKAAGPQIDAIQRLLDRFSYAFSSARGYYENRWEHVQTSATSWTSTPHPLEREEWRYYVVAFSGNGKEVYDFLLSANMAVPSLNAFAQVHTSGKLGTGEVIGWGGDQLRGTLTYEIPRSDREEVLDAAAVAQIRSAYKAFIALDRTKHPGIARAVDLLNGLKRVSYGSDLRVLGLFSIIEMLLTHNPNNKEIGDSLSHQISTKVPLLSARFAHPLDYCSFGDQSSAETVWKKLYEYRSQIAHGDNVDFTGKLQLLKSRDNAVAFLSDATRRLVRHALDEPQLVDALKPV